ncbi:MAG: exopolysaccharide biosynthesis protein [Thermoanaerobaculia bacterium]
MNRNDHLSPGDRLEAAIHSLPESGVTLAEVRDLAGRDGLMLLTIFLTVVFLVPVSVPGVSTVFGGGILLIALSRLLRRDLRLPNRIERRVVATDRLRVSLKRGLTWFRRLERLSRPHRMPWATVGAGARVVNDCGLVLAALLLMAPFGLIPFSNTLPAIAVLFLATGSLQHDGACVVLGHAAIVASIVYFAVLLGGGGLVVVSLIERLFR